MDAWRCREEVGGGVPVGTTASGKRPSSPTSSPVRAARPGWGAAFYLVAAELWLRLWQEWTHPATCKTDRGIRGVVRLVSRVVPEGGASVLLELLELLDSTSGVWLGGAKLASLEI